MRRFIRRLAVAIPLVLGALFLPMLAHSASADVSGPCSAQVSQIGADGTLGPQTFVSTIGSPGSAFKVEEDSKLVVAMFSQEILPESYFTYHRIQLEFAGFRWTVSENLDPGTDSLWTGSVNVDDYATYGKGLYKVIGYGQLNSGKDCIGIAYFDVGGNPLTTVAGGAAAAATVLGAAGLIAAGIAAGGGGPVTPEKVTDKIDTMAEEEELEEERKRERAHAEEVRKIQDQLNDLEMSMAGGRGMGICAIMVLPALLITGMTMAAGGGLPAAPAPRSRRRMSWRPRLSAFALLAGLVGGAGVVVLLQQYSVVYPTRAVAIAGLAGGPALGLIIPSLMRIFPVRRFNRAIARLEERLRELQEQQPPSAGAPSA
jgi:hypothetical protein